VLTEKGRQFAADAMKFIETTQGDVFNVLSTEEKCQLNGLLGKVFNQFCQKNKW
jgi:DNA-binding MarR family transcriptional regulator